MRIAWTRLAWAQYTALQAEDRPLVERINRLLSAIVRDPFRGEGKPEPLRNELSGWWSRRIAGEHRLIYRIGGQGEDRILLIAQCRRHY